MRYAVRIHPLVTKEDFKKLDRKILEAIVEVIETRIALRPYGFKPLQGKRYRDLWRVRFGDFRIAYKIDEKAQTVYVLCVGVRGLVYQRLENRTTSS